MKAVARSQYLQAMGVTQWLPRHALNAGESQDFYRALAQPVASVEYPDQDVHQQQNGKLQSSAVASGVTQGGSIQSGSIQGVGTQDRSRPISASHLLGGVSANQSTADAQVLIAAVSANSPSGTTSVETPSLENATQATAIAADTEAQQQVITEPASFDSPSTTPRFALYIVPLCPTISWVFDAEVDQSLLLAFGHRVKQGMGLDSGFQPNMTEFRWPFIESSQQDQSAPVATQALKAQWQFMQEQGCQQVFTWGKNSSHWFAQAGAAVAFSYPSAELKLTADIKTQVWKTLTSLL